MNATAKAILDMIRESHLATGFDSSKFNVSVDFNLAAYQQTLEVVDVGMIRASLGYADGSVSVDPLFETQYAELEQHPSVIRDFYHYLSSHSVWTKQYDEFLEAIDGKAFEILTLDCEKIYNVKSATFAGYAYYFLDQLEKDFPNKRVKIYSNRYDYMDWFHRYYPDLDRFAYHHAQYPWARWDNVEPQYMAQFLQFIKDVFAGQRTPNLPDSRKPDDYVMWQVASYTGIGEELGFGADFLDVNVSNPKMDLETFREWAHLYDRWDPGGQDEPSPEPAPVTLEAQVEINRQDIAAIKAKVGMD